MQCELNRCITSTKQGKSLPKIRPVQVHDFHLTPSYYTIRIILSETENFIVSRAEEFTKYGGICEQKYELVSMTNK